MAATRKDRTAAAPPEVRRPRIAEGVAYRFRGRTLPALVSAIRDVPNQPTPELTLVVFDADARAPYHVEDIRHASRGFDESWHWPE